MNSRLIGAILLIAGTTVGAAMLAVPVTTGMAGFIPSLFVMIGVWLFMMLTAFYFLEVTLRFKGETNFISMIRLTLGRWGEVLGWLIYLLLLYALVSAYIVGGSLILQVTFDLSKSIWPWIQVLFFGLFLYFGVHRVDWLNRVFMIGLALGYVGMTYMGIGHVSLEKLSFMHGEKVIAAIGVILTSFGYHIIIPTLTNYLKHDVKKLSLAIFIGSLLPLLVYILWQIMVLGIIPISGSHSLTTALKQGKPIISYLNEAIQSPVFLFYGKVFSFF